MADSRILLLEDDRDTADLIAHVLHGAGYTVDLASTVSQAERLLAVRAYELLIADWRLPDGDGIAVADRAANSGMKTAIISGYALQMPAERASRHEVWMKPMRPHEIIEGVVRCIGSGEVSDCK